MTDAAIIALYLKRSEQAMAESQNAYGPYCYRVAEGILHNASDSEESVNDTWLAAWDSIPPACPQSLRAYLGTLTRRISIDRLRARRAAKRGGDGVLLAIDELAECIPSSWSMEKAVEDREVIRAFNSFLGSLPETERNLFVARYWYGLPVAEIAQKFSCKQNTVLTKLRRTRIRLLAYLKKEELQ